MPDVLAIAEAYQHEQDTRIGALSREVLRLRSALEEIAGLDYRGYPHESARIARKALHEGPPDE